MMVHEERRIRNALQTPHKLISFSFETEEYIYPPEPRNGTYVRLPEMKCPQ